MGLGDVAIPCSASGAVCSGFERVESSVPGQLISLEMFTTPQNPICLPV